MWSGPDTGSVGSAAARPSTAWWTRRRSICRWILRCCRPFDDAGMRSSYGDHGDRLDPPFSCRGPGAGHGEGRGLCLDCPDVLVQPSGPAASRVALDREGNDRSGVRRTARQSWTTVTGMPFRDHAVPRTCPPSVALWGAARTMQARLHGCPGGGEPAARMGRYGSDSGGSAWLVEPHVEEAVELVAAHVLGTA